MKKILGAIALAIALALPAFAVQTATVEPAQAVSGCTSRVVDKVDTWGNDVKYWGFKIPSRLPHAGNTRLTGSPVYMWCPNSGSTSKDNMIKVKNITWCWSDYPSKVDNFDGTKMNAYFFSDGPNVNPEQARVPNKKGDWQNCVVQNIDPDKRRWQAMEDSPGWTISSWIVLSWGQPDQEHTFKWGGNGYKYFHPSEDPNVSKWYR